MITHLETFSLLFNRNVNSEIWDTAVSVSSSWFSLKSSIIALLHIISPIGVYFCD